jgi:acetyl esterase/lipase
MMTLPTRSNIAFISADYRLAPQSNIHLILEDTVDAVDFVRKVLPGRLDGKIDPTKLAVSGGSAGGWLALLTGIPTKRQPGAVVRGYRGFRPPGMKHTFENQPSQRSQGCTNG